MDIASHTIDCRDVVVRPIRPSQQSQINLLLSLRRSIMTWSKPEFSDLRFGFEITMYIANR
jgi:coenzyme PQQ precursor peptide PqqA